ncbi:hypothetical protein HQ865_05855 [Mucilaginibacter mali]|uniref:Long-subunit fatty acid transport protein n=1 Tax=Mucilaginibacter mali TaxID=2740462 RepID=A0A7D4U9R8_9SPHI|nr:hypothetical protein [Mucilaginibacter mali]QKJ29298.1 hypothetical protein HQ865_05855 [Mucilaginibacter mali]
MKPKYLLTAALIVGAARMGFAQYSQDAIRYSTFQTGSTSRIKAIGNAGTAIGGDLSSIGGNPAGIGFFTRSEFSFTPEFDGSKVKATYQGQESNTSKSSINFNNVAAVFYSRLNTPKGADKTKGWLSLNFGISYNRTNNYYEDINYGGTNKTNSVTDYFAKDANSNGLASGSLGDWAYQQNLIDSYAAGTGSTYKSNATASNINPNGFAQQSSAIRTGGQSELSLSMGANYSNQFYAGFGIGITNLRYNTNTTFTESGIASVITAVGPPIVTANQPYTTTYSQDQQTKGTGFNLKAGFIFKPTDMLRLGAVITTPTWYNIDDNYNENLRTKLNNNNAPQGGPANYPFSYKLSTPFRAAGGMAIFFKQYGFITGDVEYVDYSSASLSGDYSSSGDNNDIKTLYQSAVNAHFGAEARLSSSVFLRGGYGIQGTPLKNNGSNINTTSGGIGYRNSDYYIDFTYSHITGNQNVFPYEIGTGSPSALLNKTNDNVYVTVGFRF